MRTSEPGSQPKYFTPQRLAARSLLKAALPAHTHQISKKKADPRIDSDGSRTQGNTGYGSTSSGYGPDIDPTSSSGN